MVCEYFCGCLSLFWILLRKCFTCLGLAKSTPKTYAGPTKRAPTTAVSAYRGSSSDSIEDGFGNTGGRKGGHSFGSKLLSDALASKILDSESAVASEDGNKRRALDLSAHGGSTSRSQDQFAQQHMEAVLHFKAAQLLAGSRGDAGSIARAARLFAMAADGFTKCADPEVIWHEISST